MIRLVDTCVLIDVLRGHPAAMSLIEHSEELAGSEMTRYEVLCGLSPDEEQQTEELFAVLYWIPVQEAVSRRAAALYRDHSGPDPGIAHADYVVGATAVEFEIPLLTRNVRHFPMLPGLEPAY